MSRKTGRRYIEMLEEILEGGNPVAVNVQRDENGKIRELTVRRVLDADSDGRPILRTPCKVCFGRIYKGDEARMPNSLSFCHAWCLPGRRGADER